MMQTYYRNSAARMVLTLLVLLSACGVAPASRVGTAPTPGASPPSLTTTPLPTATPLPPTATLPAPTATPLPPTATLPAPTATPLPPTATPPALTATPLPPTATPLPPTVTLIPPTAPLPTATQPAPIDPTPIIVDGKRYTVYIDAATKPQQRYQYSCEFDAAWVVLHTYGITSEVDDIIAQMPLDQSIEPRYEQQGDTWIIYGGDIERAYSGDFTKNFLARSTGQAMVPVFEHFGVSATPVRSRQDVQAALDRGELVWMKTTVDFKPWRPALWIMPDGRTHHTVLGNDHAVVVIGYNEQVVVIRDVLGPTSSNRQRPTEYEVPWDRFLAVWAAQSNDGLALRAPASNRP